MAVAEAHRTNTLQQHADDRRRRVALRLGGQGGRRPLAADRDRTTEIIEAGRRRVVDALIPHPGHQPLAAVGATVASSENISNFVAMGAGAFISSLPPDTPYLGVTVNITTWNSSANSKPVGAFNHFSLAVLHAKGRAVASFADGHAEALDRTGLANAQVFTSTTPP